jgi:hypothetical protein
MATVDLSHVQFWQPPLNPLSSKQRPASPHIRKNSRSGLATNSRNEPGLLYNNADEILRRKAQFKSAVTATLHQERDFAFHEDVAVGAQGMMRENSRNEPV